jgi:RNA polymerase sigma-70 factor (ECF subfamily)
VYQRKLSDDSRPPTDFRLAEITFAFASLRTVTITKTSDKGDFESLLMAMQPRLYGFILKRLANREQTFDVLQRTNLVICQKAADYRPGTSFEAWAFTIARFQLMAWRKNCSRNRLVFSDTVYEQIDIKCEQEVVDDVRIDALKDCVKQLNVDENKLLEQRYHEDLPLATIASTMNMSIDAIGMRLSRIRKKLGQCVQQKLQK